MGEARFLNGRFAVSFPFELQTHGHRFFSTAGTPVELLVGGLKMTSWRRSLGLFVALASGAGDISGTLAQQLNQQQIYLINDTAASICNTVKRGKRTTD